MEFLKLVLKFGHICDRLIKVILHGGLTEWLRSLIGNQVRCNSPVGSSPMSSAKHKIAKTVAIA